MISKENLFSEYVPNRIIPGFPYVERYCPYCERLLKVYRAIHIQDMEEHYKAVLICDNPDCGAYDEETKEAYIRVYYSSEFAYKTLELIMGPDPRTTESIKYKKL